MRNMHSTASLIISYIGGIVTGLIIAFMFATFITTTQSPKNETANDVEGLQLFDNPNQTIKAKSFKIMQVLPDGSALAMSHEFNDDEGELDYGTYVYFKKAENGSFFDGQIITLQNGKCFKQIGIFQYTAKNNSEKTVPVIAILDK